MSDILSGRTLEKRLGKAAEAIEDTAVKNAFLAGIGPAIDGVLPSRHGLPPPPKEFTTVGSRRWKRDDPGFAVAMAAKRYSKTFGQQFARLLRRLHDRFPTIAEATDLTELMIWLRRNRGKSVDGDTFNDLIRKAASRAAEDTVIYDERFLGMVDEAIADVLDLGADPAQMKRLGLAKIDPQPYLFTDVAAPRKAGFPEARYEYVDNLVMFQALALDGSTRYVVKIKGQVKLMNADDLTSRLDFTGRYLVGQPVRDRERGPLGSWHVSDIRIPRESLVDDPRLVKLLTFASREFDDLELESLAADRIKLTHFVHAVSYEDFYRFAHYLVDLAGIKLAK